MKNIARKEKTIKVINELPELLEAVCNHEDCPYWLKSAIKDAIDDQKQYVVYTAASFRASFEAMNRDLSPNVPDTLDAEGNSMKNIARSKRKPHLTYVPMSDEAFDLIEKYSFEREGVLITPRAFKSINGFAYTLEFEAEETMSGILINSKLPRAERSKIINSLLKAIKENRLHEMNLTFGNGDKFGFKGTVVLAGKAEVKR